MNRIDNLLAKLKENNLDSVLVTSKANVYYYSNYYTDPHERVIAIYITQFHEPILILPNMEVEDAKRAGWSYQILGYHDHEDVWELLIDRLKKGDKLPERLGLENNDLSLERYYFLKRILPDTEMIDVQNILASLRVIKDEKEYELLKEAAALADFGIKTGIEAIKEGVTELEVIAKIEYELKKKGIQEMSFSTMALFGDSTASPHGTPGLKKIKKGDLVLFDLGVIYKGYCSDISRTVAFQSITPEQNDIYHIVLTAEKKAIEAAQVGTEVGHLDQTARNHISQAGYEEYFPHRIGHGLGVDVHEFPSMHANNDLVLQPGMCFTIEPGIYVPQTGGVRIEDMIFMTENGPEILTKSPKNLQIIE